MIIDKGQRRMVLLNECNCVVYFFPKSEQSQDSVAGLSDSSSLQDVFMDATSSQDSSHKVEPEKCSIFLEESNATGQEKPATIEDAGTDPNSSKHVRSAKSHYIVEHLFDI